MSTRKSIQTNAAVVSCDVCGRTLLRGESADVFLHGGQRRSVCELCTGRAMHEGWIREGLDDVRVRGRESRRGRGSLLSRLRSRRDETLGDALDDPYAVPPPLEPEPAEDNVHYHAVEPTPLPEPEPRHPADAPDAALYDARSVRGIPTNAELKIARALEVFNASAHPRTVSGVSRSLGAPIVSARPSVTEGSVVTIVVAWELSWYRYEVDLGNEAAGVRVVAQGSELAEIDAAHHTPNAAADDTGQLHPAASLA